MAVVPNDTADPDWQLSSKWDLADVRSLFISDVHLGSRFCQTGPLSDLLDRCVPQHIYIVGDLLDDRRFTSCFRWPAEYTRLVARLYDFAVSGTSIYYTPGNHDAFLRQFKADYRLVEIQDSFVHHRADGSRLAVIHGDQFDCVEKNMLWLSKLGSWAYEILLGIDRTINAVLGLCTTKRWPLSRNLKVGVKRIVQRKSNFHERVVQFANQNDCQSVVCGHIHCPEMREIDDVLYCNTGDWIEHCTAMVEWPDGSLQIIRADQLQGRKRKRPIFDRLRTSRASSAEGLDPTVTESPAEEPAAIRAKRR